MYSCLGPKGTGDFGLHKLAEVGLPEESLFDVQGEVVATVLVHIAESDMEDKAARATCFVNAALAAPLASSEIKVFLGALSHALFPDVAEEEELRSATNTLAVACPSFDRLTCLSAFSVWVNDARSSLKSRSVHKALLSELEKVKADLVEYSRKNQEPPQGDLMMGILFQGKALARHQTKLAMVMTKAVGNFASQHCGDISLCESIIQEHTKKNAGDAGSALVLKRPRRC